MFGITVRCWLMVCAEAGFVFPENAARLGGAELAWRDAGTYPSGAVAGRRCAGRGWVCAANAGAGPGDHAGRHAEHDRTVHNGRPVNFGAGGTCASTVDLATVAGTHDSTGAAFHAGRR